MRIFRRDRVEDYLSEHLAEIETPEQLYELCVDDIDFGEIKEIFEEVKETNTDYGPCGGAFSNWSDFWRYKEG